MTESETVSRGRIELVCGCMFSGKSERLVHCVTDAQSRGEAVIAFKHAVDDRYDQGHIVTHNGLRIEARPVASASEIPELTGEVHLVVIDEAQFFDEDLVGTCRQLADRGHQIVVAGLDRDSWGLPFGPVPALEAIANEVIRTRSTCAVCGREATYTQRLAPIKGQTMIGGAESYEPRCAKCFQPPPIELRC